MTLSTDTLYTICTCARAPRRQIHGQPRTGTYSSQNRRQKDLRPSGSLPPGTTAQAPSSRSLPHARHTQAHNRDSKARTRAVSPWCTLHGLVVYLAPPGSAANHPGLGLGLGAGQALHQVSMPTRMGCGRDGGQNQPHTCVFGVSMPARMGCGRDISTSSAGKSCASSSFLCPLEWAVVETKFEIYEKGIPCPSFYARSNGLW